MNLGEYAASQANIFQLIADVPIDATQTRQLYFTTESERDTYFASKVVASGSNTNFKFIRKSRALKVQANENSIENCNYMRFKNAGGMWWYAFVTSIEYVKKSFKESVNFNWAVSGSYLMLFKKLPACRCPGSSSRMCGPCSLAEVLVGV